MPILQQAHWLVTRDGRLRVEFEWVEDRFVHRISIDGAEVGESIDGDGSEPWPPSPPIQQLLSQEIDGSPAILGVGAAGKGHWSISVELDGDQAIAFDLACRCKETPEFLGSSYRLEPSVSIECTDSELDVSGDRRTIAASEQDSDTHRWRYRLQPQAN